jgi:protein-tyrosine phosphatase
MAIKECDKNKELLEWSKKNVKNQKNPNISLIIPGLYLGNLKGASDLKSLNVREIQVVVNVGLGSSMNQFPNEFLYVNGIAEDKDGGFEKKEMMHLIDLVHEHLSNDKKVLVHCKGGISRSAIVVIGYLMKYKKYNLIDSKNIVTNGRKQISPRKSFLEILNSL